MWKSFLSTFSFWRELSKDVRIWWIFRRTANQYRDQLNKELDEINNQEMWLAGRELRALRPENNQ